MRYTSWEQVDTTHLRNIADLPLPEKRNGRIHMYRHLEERLAAGDPALHHDAPQGCRLPYLVTDLLHLQHKSVEEIAASLSTFTDKTVYEDLVRKLIKDYNVPKMSFKESLQGKRHTPQHDVLAREQEQLARMVGAYDEPVREQAHAIGVRLLDEVPLRGNPYNHCKRVQRYVLIEHALRRECMGTTLPLWLHTAYHRTGKTREQIAADLAAISSQPTSDKAVCDMFTDFGIVRKSRADALRGKTAGRRKRVDQYQQRIAALHAVLPEQDPSTRALAGTLKVSLLDELVDSRTDERQYTHVARM
ncbi:MAG: hypothetical protein AABY13_00595, partial [Nanoarchaeota archaeon]